MNIYLVKPIDSPSRNMICVAKDKGQALLMHPDPIKSKLGYLRDMEVFLLGTATEKYTKPMLISYQKD